MSAHAHRTYLEKSAPDGEWKVRPKVMVVDDEPSNITLLKEALKADYELVIATEARSALALLEAGDLPHIMLLDIMMPGIDGLTFCRMLKRSPQLQSIPVIFITAMTDPESEERGFAAGAVDYIHKPIRLPSVRARIRTHISSRGMQDRIIELNQELNTRVRELEQLDWRLKHQQLKIGRTEESRKLFESVFRVTSEGIAIIDSEGIILAVNRSFARISGFTGDDMVGKSFDVMERYAYDAETREGIWKQVQTNAFWTGEIYSRRKNGEVYPEIRTISAVRNDRNEITHYVIVFTDISGIKDTERRLEELRWRDPVTRLSNRASLIDQLAAVVKYCHRGSVTSAMLVVDIDGFRAINDSHGFQAGDRVIREFAARLADTVNDDDTLARLSGDEFAVLMAPRRWTPDEAYDQAQMLVEQIRAAMAKPFVLESLGNLSIEITVGIALFPNVFSHSAELILQHAETAHHSAKEMGVTCAVFEDAMSREIKHQMQLESELLRAIEREELVLFAQTQCAPSGEVNGFEVLIRWQHPTRGLQSPAAFIPFAEKSGLIVKLERYILRKVLDTLSKLPPDRSLNCSVNISARHFAHPDFVPTVIRYLQESSVDPSQMTLELTESAMIDDVDTVIGKMSLLRKIGCKFSLDDFGTGYSSLSHLRRLPISEIKIDRSFVLAAPTEPTSANILEMINRIGETMGVRIVAEGVETQEHVDFLTENYPGLDMQGYFFSRPQPFEQILMTLLSSGKP